MAKTGRKNRTKKRADPLSKTVKPPSDPELAALREQKVLPILKDLTSADLKARGAAATAISNLVEDTRTRKLLLREQLVRILLEQTITDLGLETKAAGWGILRNLAIEEEADFCIHLYRQDILTAIEGVIRNIIEVFENQDSSFAKLPKAEQDLVWNLTTSVVSLLSSLSEAQEEIVASISNLPTILNFLFGLLNIENIPQSLYEDALVCLIALVEENKPIAKQISENENWLQGLMGLRAVGGMKAVAACGVLHNMFTALQWFEHNTPVDGASDAALVPTLIDNLGQAHANGGQENGQGSNASPDQVLQLALEITASIATSLQEALENGNRTEKEFQGFGDETNMEEDDVASGDEDEGEDEGEEEEREMNDEEIDADMEMIAGADSDADDNDDAPEDHQTLDLLIRKAAPVILSIIKTTNMENIEDGSTSSYALSAMNNIAWTVSSIDFVSAKHLAGLKKAWSTIAQQTWNEIISPVLASNTADIALASTITSLAWAISRSVHGQIQLQPEEHRKFMALYQASKSLPTPTTDSKTLTEADDVFQGLGVKCIGVLGRLALDPAPVELNREIGIFLLTILAALPDTKPADAVESLNEIYDIYADKSYAFDQAVFWQDGFYQHLEAIAPKMKKMAKGIDKRKQTELRSRADEAILNLTRFLKYKRTERASK